MKRMMIILAVAAFGALCFAAGDKAELKFPWAHPDLSKTREITEMEYRCLTDLTWTNDMRDVVVTHGNQQMRLTQIVWRPRQDGLVCEAHWATKRVLMSNKDAICEKAAKWVRANLWGHMGKYITRDRLIPLQVRIMTIGNIELAKHEFHWPEKE